ncbi:A disintegrin and metalloproteinase with thrombospondin motifs 20 [Liparis tanakae]|uniref:A disintegrin and metalloproteinase with thrombospondin motifs 20 n=1 Tax=Liparis tanakae TaxID=230148 RepID=A0A4Z2HAR2_9TELE|nr:A disintegrin and metalloproteinase with thrombospondin motifs 20 [Liparis tanakae]
MARGRPVLSLLVFTSVCVCVCVFVFQCAVTCGHGYQMRAVRCVSGGYGATVHDRECNAAARPRDSQDCEMQACPWAPVQSTPRPNNSAQLLTQWRYGSWTACSVSCGKGKRARYVSCRDAQGGVADESHCTHLPRPPESSACFIPCGQWRAGEWSPCPVTCGVGRTTRQVICSNYHQPVEQSFCDPDEKPAAEQECAAAPCPSVYHRQRINDQPYGYPQDPGRHPGHSSWNVPSADNQWRTGPWGACSSTCAGGFQRRVVVCQDADGRSSTYCDERCTQTCGGGRRTRLVVCQRPNGQRLNGYNCDILDKPPDMEQCNLQPCPGAASWHRQPWKPCSVSCGRGTKQRDVACVYQNQTEMEEEHCGRLPRPRTQKACRAQGCPGWKANRWTECSVTCGVGVQKRDVYCRLKGTGRVREDLCDAGQRLALVRPCQSEECLLAHYTWVAGDWEECNATCGEGARSRKVGCMGPGGTPVREDYCTPAPRPPSRQACEGAACHYAWMTGEWSQCSSSCGVGYQQRLVSCSAAPSSQAPRPYAAAQSSSAGARCAEPHPPGSRPCLLGDCPHTTSWKVGPWSKVKPRKKQILSSSILYFHKATCAFR